jgi:RNase P protein component
MNLSELKQIIKAEIMREAATREQRTVKRDLRNYLDLLTVGKELKDHDIIVFAKRGVKAMEAELDFNRYGRTDVK